MTLHTFNAATDHALSPAARLALAATTSHRWLRALVTNALALGGALASTVALAVTPTATIGITPSAAPLVGDAYCFTATMTNAGDTGYGPYMRLVLPAGVTFTSATYLTSLAATATNAGTIPTTDSIISQPVATPVTVPASTLWLIRPPIGSMVTTVGPNGFQIPIRICTQIAPTTVPNTALAISVQGAYQFGDTPTGANGAIVGGVVPAPVTPGLVTLAKSNNAPEAERPPGPAWPITYTIVANIADTKSLTAVVIKDVMPADLLFQGPLTVTGGVGCVATTPVVNTTGTITVNCTSALGTAGTGEVVVTYSAYIKIGALPLNTVQTKPEVNTATLNAQFAAAPIAQVTATSTVTAAQAVVQKSAAPTSVRPGDVVTYTLAVQTTQADTVAGLTLKDVLPDGITFGSTLSATINGTAVTVTPTVTATGGNTTTLLWNLTAAPGVVFPIPIASTVVLKYTGTVRQTYLTTTKDVLAGDVLPNSATLTATMTGGAGPVTNTSTAPVTVIPVTIQKTLLNPQPFYQPGDLVTFRLQMSIDAGRTSNLVFKDFFPLPVFDAITISTVYGVDVKRAVGGAGADTLNLTPTAITANAGENSLTINWPDVSTASGTGTNILAVDITVKVTNKPFADGLSLTNLMEASNSATGAAPLRANEGVLFKVNAPVLKIKKGVLSATGAGVIAPLPSVLPVDGNLTGADAGDVATFRITVENTGGSGAYQVKVTDTAVANLSSCTLVAVKDGLGANLAHNATLGAAFPVAGVTLANPLPKNDANPVGGGAPYNTDTALIDVSCPVNAASGFNINLVNTANVVWAAAIDSVTLYPQISDTASVTTSNPLPVKQLLSTSEAHTANPNVVVGEVIRYRLSVAVPEGGPFTYTIQDSLPAGLQFLNDGSTKFALVSQTGSGLTSSAVACANSTAAYVVNVKAGNTAGVVPACAISANHAGAYANGELPTFNFGTITNSNSDVYDEYLILDINALVVNSGGIRRALRLLTVSKSLPMAPTSSPAR
jgi:large repetitive protein